MGAKLSNKKLEASKAFIKRWEIYGTDVFEDRRWFILAFASELYANFDKHPASHVFDIMDYERYNKQSKRYLQAAVKELHPIRNWFNNLKYRRLLNLNKHGK